MLRQFGVWFYKYHIFDPQLRAFFSLLYSFIVIDIRFISHSYFIPIRGPSIGFYANGVRLCGAEVMDTKRP